MSDETTDRDPRELFDHPVLVEMVRLAREKVGSRSAPESELASGRAPWHLRRWELRALAETSRDHADRTIAAAIAVAASIREAGSENGSQLSELAREADPAGDWSEAISEELGRLSRELVQRGEIARATDLAATRKSLEQVLAGPPRELAPCPVAEPSDSSRQWLERRRAYAQYQQDSRHKPRPAWRALGVVVAAIGLVVGLAVLKPPHAEVHQLSRVELAGLSEYLASAYVGDEGGMFFGTLSPGWSKLDPDRRWSAARTLSDHLGQGGHVPALIFDSSGRTVVSSREGRLWVDPASIPGAAQAGKLAGAKRVARDSSKGHR